MGFVYLVLVLCLALMPALIGAAFAGTSAEYRRRLNAARAWGVGLRRSGPWFWRVGGGN